MLAFKFLRPGGIGPFSGVRWPPPGPGGPGDWLIAAAHGPLCVAGVHACDIDHLACWLAAELWLVELAGEITPSKTKIVAARGRLVRRVEGWDRAAAVAFAEACAGRARDLACEALRRAGEGAVADRLAASADTGSIGAIASAWAGAAAAGGGPADQAALAMGYLWDAVRFASLDPAASAFCSAHAGLTPEGFARERAWQSRRLAADLDLHSLMET